MYAFRKINEEIDRKEYLANKLEENGDDYLLRDNIDDGKVRPPLSMKKTVVCKPMEFYNKNYRLEVKDL